MNVSKVFLMAILIAVVTVGFSSLATAGGFGSFKVSAPRIPKQTKLRNPTKIKWPSNPGYNGPGSQVLRTRRIKSSSGKTLGSSIRYQNPYGFTQGSAYGYRNKNGYTGSAYRGYGNGHGHGTQVTGTVDRYGRPRQINIYGRTPLNYKSWSKSTRLPY